MVEVSMELRALADRVEALVMADREVEQDIDKMFSRQPSTNWARFFAPRYTASIDAALTLVPDDAFWRLGHDGDGADPSEFRAQLIVPKQGGRDAVGVAIALTPAFALTAAALRVCADLGDSPIEKGDEA